MDGEQCDTASANLQALRCERNALLVLSVGILEIKAKGSIMYSHTWKAAFTLLHAADGHRHRLLDSDAPHSAACSTGRGILHCILTQRTVRMDTSLCDG
jgi:hypothetical protein